MQIELLPYQLELKHSFGLSYGKRSYTDTFIVKLKMNGVEGIGEIVLPPYMKYSSDEVIEYVQNIQNQGLLNEGSLDACLEGLKKNKKKCPPAMAGLDIALHDLFSQLEGKSIFAYYGLSNAVKLPPTSFTIGIEEDLAILKQKIREAQAYEVLKLKMGGDSDNFLLDVVLPLWNKPIVIDANQGWQGESQYMHFMHRLEEHELLFVEQPFSLEYKQDYINLKRHPIPIVADESVQGIEDLETLHAYFDGINVKLMKCGGIQAAYELIKKAKTLNMKILIGCMTSSSCAIQAALNLAPMSDWLDLDGAFLVANNPYPSPKIEEGRLLLLNQSGLAIR